ncbi:lytic transglycosylase domain protein [Candidatus Vecturithrix granuli]|uniref:Lytic transglycosylase domain protein n=1 Tax=Vecturithrix granuli TaxID=1499967 RepID=A0A081C395_VECG1|nr:lytic transglycosylase domain protein [Candidatus Vecturithrix granuli]
MSPIVFFLIVFSIVFLTQPGSLGNIEEITPDVLPDQEVVKMSAFRIELPPEPGPQQRAENLLQLAHFSFQFGQHEQANQAAQQFILEQPGSLVLDYAYYYLASSYANLTRYAEARESIKRLRSSYPQSRLLAEAAFLEADTYFEQQNYATALQLYLALRQQKAYKNHPLLPEALLKLAQCYERTDQLAAARAMYHQTWKEAISTPGYTPARDHEACLLVQHPELLAPISTKDLFDSINTLLKNGKAADALPWLRRVQARSESPKLEESVVLKFAETYYLLRENAKSRAYYREFLRDYPQSKLVPYAFDRIGRLYLREGRLQDFLSISQRLRKEYPTSAYTAAAVRLHGKELELQGRFREAIREFNEFLQKYPKNALAPDVLWSRGWCQYQLQEDQAALNTFDMLIRSYPKSDHRNQALYWAGRAAERMQRYTRAAEYYTMMLKIGQPRSYLGELSLQSLTRLKQRDPNLRVEPPPTVATPLPFDKLPSFSTSYGQLHWQKTQELERLGLPDLAAEELAHALEQEKGSQAAYLTLAHLYSQAGKYHELVRLMQRHFWLWIVRGGDDLPQEFWNYAYPLSFFEITSRHTADSTLDPFLVQALMMAESLFDPHAVSPVGALGLMQLMPATGARLAAGLGLEIDSSDQYLRPEINILLGTTYLRQLLELFQNELPPVIASYNAGEQRVKEWRRNADPDDPAAFVAMIPYRETQNYVQKVLWYYQEYRRIYSMAQGH